MPTATPFTALGKGNGFTSCVSKVDVSGFDNWVTLGGVSSGSASTAEINTSLANCMKLRWNFYSATASFTSSWQFNNGVDPTLEFIKNNSGSLEVTPIPKGRICGVTSTPSISKEMTPAELAQTGGVGAGGSATLRLDPIRMYNGDTDDELKFVGYGLQNLYISVAGADHEGGALSGSAEITISSFLNGTTDEQVDTNPGVTSDAFIRTASSIKLDNLPFRSVTLATVSSNTQQMSLSGLSATSNAASVARTNSTEGSSAFESISGSVGVPSNFDFYTY